MNYDEALCSWYSPNNLFTKAINKALKELFPPNDGHKGKVKLSLCLSI
jgi:hypothetical protein